MGRPKKDQDRTTVSMNKRTKELVRRYADERGIDFSAAVNVLLYEAMQHEGEVAAENEPDYPAKHSNAAGDT